tara:strand:+ start:705 stop:950 length:246 start_codon:yes stop_codon:yes gene_type:complete
MGTVGDLKRRNDIKTKEQARKTIVLMPVWSVGQCRKWNGKKDLRQCPIWGDLADGFCEKHWDSLWQNTGGNRSRKKQKKKN